MAALCLMIVQPALEVGDKAQSQKAEWKCCKAEGSSFYLESPSFSASVHPISHAIGVVHWAASHRRTFRRLESRTESM